MKKLIALILCTLLMFSAIVPSALAFGPDEEPEAPAVDVAVQDEADFAEPEGEPVPVEAEPEAEAEMPDEEPVPLAGEDPADPEPEEPDEVTLVADSVSVKGVLPEGTELVAEEIADPFAPKPTKRALLKSSSATEETARAWEAAAYYDIKLLSGSEALRPEDAVTVTIENVPFKYEDGIVSVRHFLDDEAAIAAGIADGTAEALYGDKYAEALPAAAEAAEAVTGEKGVVYVETITEAEGLTVNGTTVTFPAKSFSIYAIVEGSPNRLKVIFTKADNSTVEILVKAADIPYIDTVISNPGTGTIPEGQVFRGWTTTYPIPDDVIPKEIDEIRDEIVAKLNSGVVTDLEEFNVYAVLSSGYSVVFKDEAGAVISSNRVSAGNSYEMVLSYSPVDQNAQFLGWTSDNGATYYAIGQSVTVNSDLVFVPMIKTGYWLIFEENDGQGGGADYIAPRIVSNDEDALAVKPDDPNRPGYSFVNWYTGAPAVEGEDPTGSVFEWNQHLSGDTTIYAKWELATDTNYTVVIWIQSIDDDKNAQDDDKTYEYFNTYYRTAPTGATVNDSLLDEFINKTDEGFTFPAAQGNVINTAFQYRTYDIDGGVGPENNQINANGRTVINVFYDRALFTITFRNETRTGTILHTFTGLYGQPLSKYNYTWPTAGTGKFWYSVTYLSSFRGNLFGSSNLGPSVNVGTPNLINTFTMNTNPGNDYALVTIIFYTQDLSLESYSEASRTTYEIKKNGRFNVTDRFVGMTFSEYCWSTSSTLPTSGWKSNLYNDNLTGDTRGNNTYLHIRYNRVRHDIRFVLGADNVADANGNEYGSADYGAKDIPYQKPIAEYQNVCPTTVSTMPGYYFVGWYQDEALTKEMDWSKTMPEEDLIVYGKVEPMRYRVVLHLNGGSFVSTGSTSFRLDNDDVVQIAPIEYADHALVGWYYDESLSPDSAFSLNTKIWPSTPGMNMNYQSSSDWGTYPSDGDNVRGILHLYAKWRAVLDGANGISVEYVYPDGSAISSVSDNLLYQDNADAYAAEAPASPPEGVTDSFQYWKIMKYEDGQWVETGEHVRAGDLYRVRLSYAKETEIDPPVNGISKEYLVQLKTYYAPIGSGVTTHVIYEGNGGHVPDSTDTSVTVEVGYNVDFELLGNGTFVRDGYDFIGWAFSSTGEKTFNGGETVAADILAPSDNTLYALWQEKTVTVSYHVSSLSPEDSGNVSPTSETFGAVTGTPAGQPSGEPSGSLAAPETGFKFVGWYTDDACENPAGENYMFEHFVPSRNGDNVYVDADYYAKFEYDTTTLTITNKSGHDAIFKVTGKGYTGLILAIPAEESLTIANVYVGEDYTITMDTGWSWRYDSFSKTIENLDPGANSYTVAAQTMAKTKWLSGTSYAWKYEPTLYDAGN